MSTNKELQDLQDLAWRFISKEFKEVLKKRYQYALKHYQTSSLQRSISKTLEHFFGIDNLTSNAEGEEMLTCEKSKVQEQYALNVNALRKGNLTDMQTEIATKVKDTLCYLFGFKCLPDEKKESFSVGDVVVFHPFKTNSFYDAKIIEIKDGVDKPYLLQCGSEQTWAYPIEVQSIAETYPDKEPQPAEPKFKVGDKVVFKCSDGDAIQTIHSCKYKAGYWFYNFAEGGTFFDEYFLEPYAEPTCTDNTPTCTNDCPSQCSSPNRLHIAAMAMQGILSNYTMLKNLTEGEYSAERIFHCIAKAALSYTDALIAEANNNDSKNNQQ